MGRVVTPMKLTNGIDHAIAQTGDARYGLRECEAEALVDTGATFLCLRPSLITRLGLPRLGEKRLRTANGIRVATHYGPVWLEVMGRGANFDVVDIDEDSPNLLGLIPLEALDFIRDPGAQRLIGNPAHGGNWEAEAY